MNGEWMYPYLFNFSGTSGMAYFTGVPRLKGEIKELRLRLKENEEKIKKMRKSIRKAETDAERWKKRKGSMDSFFKPVVRETDLEEYGETIDDDIDIRTFTINK